MDDIRYSRIKNAMLNPFHLEFIPIHSHPPNLHPAHSANKTRAAWLAAAPCPATAFDTPQSALEKGCGSARIHHFIVLARAQQHTDGGLLVRFLYIPIERFEIKAQLAQILRLKSPDLQLDGDQTIQPAMEEKKIKRKVPPADLQRIFIIIPDSSLDVIRVMTMHFPPFSKGEAG